MVIFLVTIVVGILNGLDVIEFDRKTLMAHVHAGTLGWITLGIFGATMWLFSGEKPATQRHARYVRWLSIVAIVAIALYVLTLFLAEPIPRPIAGSLVLLVIAGFLGWVIAQSWRIKFTVPHLALLAALITLTIGAVLGVLMVVYLAGGAKFLPQGAFMSHPASLVAGYLILAGMAITEWGLKSRVAPASISRLGIAQVVLPFLGGLALMLGSLLDIFALIILIVPFQIGGVLIYLARLGSGIMRARWLEGSNSRLFALSAVFLAVNVAMTAYLIANYADRFEEIPSWLLFALDHAIFIGLLTNGLFGLVYEVSRAQRSFWPWADHVLFWGMNAGLVGFVAGLILQEAIIKQIFTPIMGMSILLAMLTYTIRVQTEGRR
ncbi:MAG: hypothetical protein HY530_06275 [Chloroflexi bacterium]|nr:hypothetical protein [Chloroflexota bacterium]